MQSKLLSWVTENRICAGKGNHLNSLQWLSLGWVPVSLKSENHGPIQYLGRDIWAIKKFLPAFLILTFICESKDEYRYHATYNTVSSTVQIGWHKGLKLMVKESSRYVYAHTHTHRYAGMCSEKIVWLDSLLFQWHAILQQYTAFWISGSFQVGF